MKGVPNEGMPAAGGRSWGKEDKSSWGFEGEGLSVLLNNSTTS